MPFMPNTLQRSDKGFFLVKQHHEEREDPPAGGEQSCSYLHLNLGTSSRTVLAIYQGKSRFKFIYSSPDSFSP